MTAARRPIREPRDVVPDRPLDAVVVVDTGAETGRDAGSDGAAPVDASMADVTTAVDATASDSGGADAPTPADAGAADSGMSGDAAAPASDAGKSGGGGDGGCGCATAPTWASSPGSRRRSRCYWPWSTGGGGETAGDSATEERPGERGTMVSGDENAMEGLGGRRGWAPSCSVPLTLRGGAHQNRDVRMTGRYAARNATKSKGTASLKLNRDPLGSQFLNDLAEPS